MDPILFQPPYPLTWTPELWVIARCKDDEDQPWCGGEVAWSEEEGSAEEHGPYPIGAGVVVGGLARTLPAPTPRLVGTDWHFIDHGIRIAVAGPVLTTATLDAAARCQTLCYVGDGREDYELIAYTRLRLVDQLGDAQVYLLEGALRRGLYGTRIREHAPGERFARLDAFQVGRIPLEHRLLAARARLYLRLRDVEVVDPECAEDPADVKPIPFDLQWTEAR